jgi:hypothetical protein
MKQKKKQPHLVRKTQRIERKQIINEIFPEKCNRDKKFLPPRMR